jgi:hypothetical protein
MDAPSFSARARNVIVSALTLSVVAALLALPRASADDLDTVDVNSKATFSVIPRHCYLTADEVRPGPCRIKRYGAHRPTVIVWGDSHAAQQIPALRVKARQTRTNLIAFSMGLCPPMVVKKSDPDPCSRNAYDAMRFIERKAAHTRQPLTVVLGGFWYFYRTTRTGDRSERAATFRAGDDELFARLGRLSRQHGLRVVAVNQSPWVPPDSKCSLQAKVCSRSVMIPAEASQTAYLTRHLRSIPEAQLISVADQLCSDRYCRVTACDVPVFYDIVHLNSTLTARFAPLFDWAFRDESSHRYVAEPCGVAPWQGRHPSRQRRHVTSLW